MDDGIELNFAVSDGLKRKAVSKGGRWTDRAAARKTARQNVKAAQKARRDVAPSKMPSHQVQVPSAPRQPAIRPPPVTPSEPRGARLAEQGGGDTSRPSDSALARAVLEHASAPGPSRSQVSKPAPQPSAVSSSTKGKGPQIISSLFSSNPSYQAVKTTGSTVIGAPSNAPLKGDANTFAGLGLDPLLVHHLTNKMSLRAPTGIQRSALPYLLSEPLDINARAVSPLDENDEERSSTGSPKGKERAVEEHQAGLRDVLIQSQTGSGKTLTYLLPIVQTLLPLSRLSYIDRSIGTLAIIVAPTRELAGQIEKVLEHLLSMALSLPGAETDEHYTRWLVSGLFTGGATKTHEKARLRKGVPIIVATPGRLLDHLQSTSSFQCGKALFLVLDEADRLMDLGFEETITGIIKALDGRRKLAVAAEKEMDEVGGGTMRWPFWNRGRTTMLCSATVDAKVERLAGMSLRDPVIFRSEANDQVERNVVKDKKPLGLPSQNSIEMPSHADPDKFTPPSQLSQRYIVTPTKLRLVTLVALLRSLVSATSGNGGNKIIVFLSSTDTVDYHWKLLGGVKMDDADQDEQETSTNMISLSSPILPKTTIQRLHGSLPLATRKASLAKFTEASESPSILLATSVASRGLDLPLVRAVVQYDLPTEGGANEYVHRVGRTARAGKGGEAWAFVGPAEIGWVKWVEEKMGLAGDVADANAKRTESSVRLTEAGVEDILRKGFGGSGYEYEARATDVQMAFERWVLASDSNAALARKAFGSFMRAYSTHPIEEKPFFHPKSLHLGHLAKSFALRETPSTLGTGQTSKVQPQQKPIQAKRKRDAESSDEGEKAAEERPRGGKELTARNKTEERMYAAVRKAGRNVKSGGTLGEFSGTGGKKSNNAGTGGGEFQVMDGNEIERMLSGRK
ncbi:P-loop containing nucleoside triphosphate hydrolase protein [Kockovaella imperatae]|uniref:ATP-dependent RNA helicase n=1 Tax=Kockovaella imperatae TaxID=4999 RepID=A0A1Y1U7D2_9TREE|nr:P-loop containing nucleoside triphosphate hydrolase protein [Kockovaella imperatae]ORX33933.1 P-loop containing nucleoside triphosphate hydrolase protein [Kockovaella imperatae]